jgi:hypothetical protein
MSIPKGSIFKRKVNLTSSFLLSLFSLRHNLEKKVYDTRISLPEVQDWERFRSSQRMTTGQLVAIKKSHLTMHLEEHEPLVPQSYAGRIQLSYTRAEQIGRSQPR